MGFNIPNKIMTYEEMKRKTKEELAVLIESQLVKKLGHWYYTKSTLCDILNYEYNNKEVKP